MHRPAASISLDLDNLWSYLKTQGTGAWQSFPSYLPLVVPRILDTLDRCNQRITFFIVGRDAAAPEHQCLLRSIADAGHEIANHSHQHEPWLHLYDDDQLAEEITAAAKAIEHATGKSPTGFRGPGFSTSPAVRNKLAELGYRYDASVFPSALGPVARLFFFLKARHLSAAERKRRQGLYGKFSDAFGSLSPFTWDNGLIEIPVTTLPLLRLPMHTSYLMFLARGSPALARLYWNSAVTLCRLRHVAPSLLLHPTDFLDVTDVPEMAFFPGMTVPSAQKTALVEHTIRSLQKHWKVGTMAAHADAFTAAPSSSKLAPQPA